MLCYPPTITLSASSRGGATQSFTHSNEWYRLLWIVDIRWYQLSAKKPFIHITRQKGCNSIRFYFKNLFLSVFLFLCETLLFSLWWTDGSQTDDKHPSLTVTFVGRCHRVFYHFDGNNLYSSNLFSRVCGSFSGSLGFSASVEFLLLVSVVLKSSLGCG